MLSFGLKFFSLETEEKWCVPGTVQVSREAEKRSLETTDCEQKTDGDEQVIDGGE